MRNRVDAQEVGVNLEVVQQGLGELPKASDKARGDAGGDRPLSSAKPTDSLPVGVPFGHQAMGPMANARCR